MGMTQAFTAVGQVQAHGRAGSVGVLAGDGLEDFFVLAAQAVQVVLLIIMSQTRRIDSGTRNDAGTQMGHDVDEVAVAGGQGDLQVELKV